MKSVPHKTMIVLTLSAILISLLVTNLDEWRALRQLAIAKLALQNREPDQALNAAREASHLSPSNGEAHLVMARAHRRQGELNSVRRSLEKAARLGVPAHRIRREEWLAMAQAGQMTEAAPHLPELLVAPGEDGPEICEAFANGYFLTYQLREALLILDAWEKDFPKDPQPHVFRAAMDNKTAAWGAAVTHLRKAFQLAPQRHDIRIELASALLTVREITEAASHFEILLKALPDHADVLIGWGQVLLEQGQTEQAQVFLTRALRSNPDNVVALRALGQLQLSRGNHSEAIRHLNRAIEIKKHDWEAHYILAAALLKSGHAIEAQGHYKIVAKSQEVNLRLNVLIDKVRSNSKDIDSRFEIAQLLRDFGEPSDRVQWLRSVVALDPNHQAANTELAEHYSARGDLEESRKHRERADQTQAN